MLVVMSIGHAEARQHLRVVSDIPPVHSLVASVSAGVNVPTLLLDSGHSPHHFSTKPSHAKLLQNADIVFLLGGTLLPQLNTLSNSVIKGESVVSLMDLPGTKEADNFDGHIDPHAWLDPRNAIVWVRQIGDEFIRLDPNNKTIYTNNVQESINSIEQTYTEIKALLKPFRSSPYLVQHDAYNYFEDAMLLTGGQAIARSDARLPGAKKLREMRKQAQQAHCLFTEEQHDASFIDVVSGDTNARRATLDPLGTRLAANATMYTTLLSNLAMTMADCLSGENKN